MILSWGRGDEFDFIKYPRKDSDPAALMLIEEVRVENPIPVEHKDEPHVSHTLTANPSRRVSRPVCSSADSSRFCSHLRG